MKYHVAFCSLLLSQLVTCAPSRASLASDPALPQVVERTPASDSKPLPTFIVRLEKSGIVLNGKSINGTYGQLDTGDGPLIGFNGSPKQDAVVLSLNSAGNLVIDSLNIIGYQDPGQTQELLHFEDAADAYATGVPAVCSVAGEKLSCAAGPNNIFVLCPGQAVTNDLFLVSSVQSGCVAVTLKIMKV